MGYRNPLTGPFTVDGGTVDTVTGDVQGDILGSVAAVLAAVEASQVTGDVLGNIGGDVLGSVAAVVAAVVASQVTGDILGHLAGDVQGHVVGDVQGNVLGSVASVTTAVATASGSVDIVTTNVPILGRDYFYWPAMKGEAFAPTLLTGVGYSSKANQPCYSIGNTSVGQSGVTFPNVPRTNPVSGAQRVKIQFRYMPGAGTGVFFSWGMISLGLTAIGATNTLQLTSGSGAITKNGNYVPSGAGTSYDLFEINIDSAGTITVSVNGAIIITQAVANAIWPPSLNSTNGLNPGFIEVTGGGTSATGLQFSWS